MTDNEIIKAMDICGHIEACEDCPLNDLGDVDKCVHTLMLNALDLINRQEEESERLYKTLDYRAEKIRELEQEIKRLQKDSKRLKKVEMQLDDAMKMYATIKAEGIKEFAERLKEKASSCVASRNGVEIPETKTYQIRGITLDDLVKEMDQSQE